ncbi:hypothetical protein ACJJIF_02755 [Microbulbifer sp. SSSA002]|uniref:hypothetical protein n=1 Tax=unclassified Microbulbifer TaxID=2619833 RepID=UPI004039824C
MKRLLIPLIILLLIIGYFMSRSGERKAQEAYNSMEQEQSGEQMKDSSTPPGGEGRSDSMVPSDSATDGTGSSDVPMPQEPAAPEAAGDSPDASTSGEIDTGTDEGMESNTDQQQ